jgi:Phage Tail Collar Domain/Collagen triple helix repeat (20 copies)
MKALRLFAISFAMTVVGTAAAHAAPSPKTIIACYDRETGRARIVNSVQDCRHDEGHVSWNVEGPQGPTGAEGPAGPKGATGPTGSKGAEGSAGPAGPKGVAGPQGVAGPVGPAGTPGAQGPIGLTGPAGATGAAGPSGAKGATGPQGAAGPVGPAGAAGAIGPQGTVGPQGPSGPVGPVGPIGPAGPQGTSGTQSLFGSNSINFFTEGGGGAECTLGSILLNASVIYTSNYLPADGRLISISSNTALFSLLGTNYGGDGTTDYALPDLRKAAPNNTQYLICVSGIFP